MLPVVDRCKDLGIDLILGERAQSIDLKVDLDEGKRSRYLVTTSKGKELEADLVVSSESIHQSQYHKLKLNVPS